ncbi:MAG: type II toxin-antitoxin system RelE/ParE family toxin [Sulfurimonas sp.]|uniref:type II toxin-antitoxin system RelE/ParE family toxin n=1 Tax=Sulfurimonas sp. TaxID=2022749 RepID=UPI002609958A|nr:type II toxin-antitoxin system RelE/ParE family toxin [Sulfurimonas sp.]MCW8894428.1 type II toxin-antitoxin system RelE/ParE family toxin [Sulfurimonas sp.]MCW8953467.1 type II toxin-antitoxin system RelE/ParE family toxin [Sulfurimonas sp.]MCW9067728.1 type II toxin-antitoxin system RelE/ParE family toxin [Sulfurimonas sp.]
MSKIYKIKWTSNAKEDLLNIVDYIKKDNLSAARKIYEQIKEKAQSSNFFSLRGRVVPELLKEGITIYRELIAQPYRIMYKIENDTVYIMAIFDSRQNVEELLLQKLLRGHMLTNHRSK